MQPPVGHARGIIGHNPGDAPIGEESAVRTIWFIGWSVMMNIGTKGISRAVITKSQLGDGRYTIL
jgi:hypothetical protein